jgi:hypothetical protein
VYSYDESGWPLVRVRFEEPTTMEDMREYIARWEGWLARGEPMGVIASYEGEQEKSSKEVRRLANRWQKESRERIGERCVGIAMCVKSSKLLAFYKPIASRAMKKKMGCPGAVFDGEREAEAWLRERLAEATVGERVGR